MSQENFKIRHGLSVGDTEVIDADGNITATTLTVGGSTVSNDEDLLITEDQISNLGTTVVLDSDIGVTVEAYDSTILKDADIGSTVQAYDANIVSDGSYVHTDNNLTDALVSTIGSALQSETSHTDVVVDGDFTTAGFMVTDGNGGYSVDGSTYVTTTSVQALHSTDALSLTANVLYLNKADGTNESVDLSLYLDDTNLARIISGTYDSETTSLVFTRDDETTFSIDASMFFDDTNLVTSVDSLTGAVDLSSTYQAKDDNIVSDANYAHITVTTSSVSDGTTTFNKYVHPSYDGDDIDVDTGALTGATVVSGIDFNITTDTEGHVTDANGAVVTRTLTLADLGYTGTTDANTYVHPSYASDDINLDTGALSGATVISDLDFNVTTDALGHVTDANGSVATRTLTLANLGYTGATNANYYTHPSYAGDDINLDTGALSGATVISDLDFNVTTDTSGHVTDANATYSTRNLTYSDVGAAAASHSHSYLPIGSRYNGNAEDITTSQYRLWDVSTSSDAPSGAVDGLLLTGYWDSTSWATQQYHDFHTNDLYLRNKDNGTWQSWDKVWHAGNDGSGSGLDADTLDGSHASSFMTTSHPANNITSTHLYMANGDGFVWNDTTNVMSVRKDGTDYVNIDAGNISSYANNYTHPSYAGDDINLDTGALSGATVISDLDFNVTTDTQGHVTDANATYSTRNLTYSDVGALGATQKAADSELLDGINSSQFVRLDAENNGDITFPTTNAPFSNGSHSDLAPMSFRLWDNYNAGGPISYGTVVDIYGRSGHSRHQLNMYNQDLRVRSGWYGNDTWSGWDRIFTDSYHPNADKWTTARTLSLSGDASGSVSWDGSANATLSVTVANDSHTHDGRYYTESESDARFVNVTGDTMTGNLQLSLGNRINIGGGSTSYLTDNGTQHTPLLSGSGNVYIKANNDGGGTTEFVQIHAGADTVGLRVATNTITYKGNTMWHAGNDGSGSGLDADLLDGQHGSYYQPASTAITTSNIGSQSVSYATSAGDADTLDGHDTSYFQRTDNNYVDFYVEGDADTYYPVGIGGGGLYQWGSYNITRGYSWTAPSTWYSSTHKGGLTFEIDWSGDSAWGGNDHALRVKEFAQSYSTMVAGLGLATNGGNLIVWLRGGHARYRLYSPLGTAATPVVYLDGFTASNGVVWSPRTDTSHVTAEINNRYPVRGNGGLYVDNNAVWHAGNDGSGSGLDADLLDGNHASAFAAASHTHSYMPLSGGTFTGNIALSDSKLYLRTNGDTNHYLWNNASDYEELVYYTGSGFRVTSSTGLQLALFNNSGLSVAGTSSATGDMRAPIFYDSNNTAYYSNPASTSVMNECNFAGKVLMYKNVGSAPVYNSGQLELRNTDAGDVSMGFHRSGYTACQLRHEGNGLILSSTSATGSANFYAYGNITAYSDARYKKNIEKITDAIEKVKLINGYTFERTNAEDPEEIGKRKTGVLAQEVLEVLPEVICEDKRGYYSVDYGNMAGLFIEAIKELSAKVEELEAKLADK